MSTDSLRTKKLSAIQIAKYFLLVYTFFIVLFAFLTAGSISQVTEVQAVPDDNCCGESDYGDCGGAGQPTYDDGYQACLDHQCGLCQVDPPDGCNICASFNCPNGDTNNDQQCTDFDEGATHVYSQNGNCGTPACGQIDWYEAWAGGAPDWNTNCAFEFTGGFPNCGDDPPGNDVTCYRCSQSLTDGNNCTSFTAQDNCPSGSSTNPNGCAAAVGGQCPQQVTCYSCTPDQYDDPTGPDACRSQVFNQASCPAGWTTNANCWNAVGGQCPFIDIDPVVQKRVIGSDEIIHPTTVAFDISISNSPSALDPITEIAFQDTYNPVYINPIGIYLAQGIQTPDPATLTNLIGFFTIDTINGTIFSNDLTAFTEFGDLDPGDMSHVVIVYETVVATPADIETINRVAIIPTGDTQANANTFLNKLFPSWLIRPAMAQVVFDCNDPNTYCDEDGVDIDDPITGIAYTIDKVARQTTYMVGSQITYDVYIQNIGEEPLTELRFTDDYADGTTLVPPIYATIESEIPVGSGNWVTTSQAYSLNPTQLSGTTAFNIPESEFDTMGALQPDQRIHLEITFTADQVISNCNDETLDNDAAVIEDSLEWVADDACVFIEEPSGEFDVLKEIAEVNGQPYQSGNIVVGDEVTFRVLVENLGSTTITGFDFSDFDFDTELTFANQVDSVQIRRIDNSTGLPLGPFVNLPFTYNGTIFEITATDIDTTAGALDPGQSYEIIFTFTASAPTTQVCNTFLGTSVIAGTNGDQVCISILEPQPNYTITKTANYDALNNPANVGDDVTYTITITNTGNSVLDVIDFQDYYSNNQYLSEPPTLITAQLLSSNLTAADVTNQFTFDVANNTYSHNDLTILTVQGGQLLGDLVPGDSIVLTFTSTSLTDGYECNNASVFPAPNDSYPTASDNACLIIGNVIPPNISFVLDKEAAAGTYVAGTDQVEYSILITNDGDEIITNLLFQDSFPTSNFSLVNAYGNAGSQPDQSNPAHLLQPDYLGVDFANNQNTLFQINDITTQLGDLGVGQSYYIVFVFDAIAGDTNPVCNDVSAETLGIVGTDQSCVTVQDPPTPDFTITKTAGNPVVLGQNIDFTVVITNNSQTDAITDYDFSDIYDPTYLDFTAQGAQVVITNYSNLDRVVLQNGDPEIIVNNTTGSITIDNLQDLVGDIAPGQRVELVFTFGTETTSDCANTSAINTAGISVNLSNWDTDEDCGIIDEPTDVDYILYKQLDPIYGSNQFMVGDELTFYLQIRNDSQIDFDQVMLNDSFDPAYLQYLRGYGIRSDRGIQGDLNLSPSGGIINLDLTTIAELGPTLPANTYYDVYLTFRALDLTIGPDTCNAAYMNPDNLGPSPQSNACVDITDDSSLINYTITKGTSTGAQADLNEIFDYQFTITNTGSTPLTNVTFSDTYPNAYVSYLGTAYAGLGTATTDISTNVTSTTTGGSTTLGLDDNLNNLILSGNALDPGESIIITLSFQAIQVSQSITNTATIDTTEGGSATDTYTLEIIDPAQLDPVFELDKSIVNNPNPRVGEQVTFLINVRNSGTLPITTIYLADSYYPSILRLDEIRGYYSPTGQTNVITNQGFNVTSGNPQVISHTDLSTITGLGDLNNLNEYIDLYFVFTVRSTASYPQDCNIVQVMDQDNTTLTDYACIGGILGADVPDTDK